jgi:hypothetical protein
MVVNISLALSLQQKIHAHHLGKCMHFSYYISNSLLPLNVHNQYFNKQRGMAEEALVLQASASASWVFLFN